MTTEFIDPSRNYHSAAQAPRHCPPPGPRNRDRSTAFMSPIWASRHLTRHPLAAGSGHRRARRPIGDCD